MRIVLGALVTTTMLAVVGCSTTAQNPNYQQITKYKGSTPYTDAAVVQQARYQTQAPAPIVYAPQEVLSQVPQQVNYNADSGQAVIYQASATPNSQIGIQENTESLGEGGTPGYYAVNGIEPASQAAPQQYTQIQTLNPQQIVPQPLSVPTGFTSVSTQAGSMRHHVIVGDTLYSLARTTCSSVAEIQRMNTINNEFYIRAGDDILVPVGRCVE